MNQPTLDQTIDISAGKAHREPQQFQSSTEIFDALRQQRLDDGNARAANFRTITTSDPGRTPKDRVADQRPLHGLGPLGAFQALMVRLHLL